MNNFIVNCFEFIADTYKNRPRNEDGAIELYNGKDRDVLLKTIEQRKKEVKQFKKEISKDTYDLLLKIYELVRMQLENRQI